MPESGIQQWRTRPIFISSTFRDMHAERDCLRQHVFPRLEEELLKRRHHLESFAIAFQLAAMGRQSALMVKGLSLTLSPQ